MQCIICKDKKSLEFVSKYKLEIDTDERYFKNPDIYRCKFCDFGFVHPMPKENDLSFFTEMFTDQKVDLHFGEKVLIR